MSRTRRVAHDLVIATGVQSLAFLVSAVSAFVVPRVMPVDAFGYWQLFLFYVGYLGFLQAGLSDGAYLRFGGISRTEIGKTSASAEFWVLLATQAVAGGGLLALGCSSLPGGRGEAILALGVMLPVFSLKRYLGYLLQAMGEPRRFSFSLLVSSITLAGPLLALVTRGEKAVHLYLASYVLAEVAGLVYCLYYARGIIGTPPSDVRLALKESWVSVRVGVKLLVATSAGALILGVSRIVIDSRWSIAVFAQVSLAVTLVGFVLTLMAQVSLVLYPVLRRASDGERSSVLLHLRSVLVTLLPFGYVMYFPMASVLSVWLPEYAPGIRMASLLMPICVFDGLMQALYSTHLKVARRERELMYLNLGAVGIAAAGAVIGGYWLGSIEFVLLSSALAGAARVVVADGILRSELGVRWSGTIEANVLVSIGFVLAARELPTHVDFSVVVVGMAVVVALRRSTLRASIAAIRRSLQRKE